MLNIKSLLFAAFIIFLGNFSFAQIKEYSFGEGLRFTAKDSTFGIKASFRFQTLFEGDWTVRNDDLGDIGDFSSNFLISRARLKFKGFAYSPKLTYKVELAVSNRDMDHDGTKYYGEGGNLVLDAYLKWNFYKAFSLQVGQYKLPGNRERLVSSANMQLVDRSLLNSRFNLDRDIGAMLFYNKTLGKRFGLQLIASFAQGEGRNLISGNIGGYQTTFKVEIMPFGEFIKKGAYSGGDIHREETPKLAIAVAFDKNHGVARTRANLGDFLPENAITKDLTSIFADFMFKYKGFSMMGEYAFKKSDDNDPRVRDINNNYTTFSYFTGSAFNLQAGYLFKSNYELAARFTRVQPQNNFVASNSNEFTLGASKYFKGHNLKVQTDLGYTQNQLINDGLSWRVQIEIGF